MITLSVPAVSTSTAGSGTTPTAAAADVVCNAVVNNPHWSRNGSTILYKTTVTCDGVAEVNVEGYLFGGPQIGPGLQLASSNETQTAAPGVTLTFYTPQIGSAKVPCTTGEYYQGYSYITATIGTSTSESSGPSNKVPATCP